MMDHGNSSVWIGRERCKSTLFNFPPQLIAFIVRFSWKKKKSSFNLETLTSQPLYLKQQSIKGHVKSFRAFLVLTNIYGVGPLTLAKCIGNPIRVKLTSPLIDSR